MKIIIDSNILFSLLISKNSKFRHILFNAENKIFSPNFVFSELFKYKEKILKFSKSDEAKVYELLNLILEKIHFVNEELVSLLSRKKAYNLCKDVDENDTPFLALSIEIDGYLWTGDKVLKNHLIKNGFNKILEY